MKITLYFDCISPYSYFGWVSLLRYQEKWNLDLELKPFFLGGVMNISGNQPPAMLPSRAVFQMLDIARNSACYDLPILPSPGNFFSEAAKKVLNVQRLLIARQLEGASKKEMQQLLSACFYAIHSDKANRSDSNDLVLNDDVLIRCLTSCGMTESQAKASLKKIASKEVKDKLQENTKEAVEAGAYGSPTMLVHGGKAPFYDGQTPMFFFGSDRMEQLAFICDLPYHGVNPSFSKM